MARLSVPARLHNDKWHVREKPHYAQNTQLYIYLKCPCGSFPFSLPNKCLVSCFRHKVQQHSGYMWSRYIHLSQTTGAAFSSTSNIQYIQEEKHNTHVSWTTAAAQPVQQHHQEEGWHIETQSLINTYSILFYFYFMYVTRIQPCRSVVENN